MRNLADDLRADAEIQALKQEFRDLGETPPPFHFDCFRDFEHYKAEMRADLAALREKQTDD